jgi:methionyl aminopeptidase
VAPNSVICHGIPSTTTILREGDIVGLDIGVILDGWYGDACITLSQWGQSVLLPNSS